MTTRQPQPLYRIREPPRPAPPRRRPQDHRSEIHIHIRMVRQTTARHVRFAQPEVAPAARTRFVIRTNRLLVSSNCQHTMKPILMSAVTMTTSSGPLQQHMWSYLDSRHNLFRAEQQALVTSDNLITFFRNACEAVTQECEGEKRRRQEVESVLMRLKERVLCDTCEEPGDIIFLSMCNHTFCEACLEGVKGVCPTCDAPVYVAWRSDQC